MELLIVDDEAMAIQGISMALEWEELGISQIWTAMSIAEARDIIMEEHVGLMLCDIEMRSENGLHLVDWVNKNYPSICCIMLTGHVNFEYTRKAIELKVMDYLSKPVDAESLKNALKKAISIQGQNQKKQEVESRNKMAVERHFFRRLLRGDMSREEIRMESARQQIPMPIDRKYCMLFVRIRKWNEEYTEEDKAKIHMAMATALAQDFLKQYHVYAQKTADDAMTVSLVSENQEGFMEKLMERAKKYIDYCGLYYRSALCVYLDGQIPIEELGSRLKVLKKYDRDNLLYNEGVFAIKKRKPQEIFFMFPDTKIWRLLLEHSSYEELKTDITKYMRSDYFIKNLNPERLRKMINDFEDMVVVFLSSRGLPADAVKGQERVKLLRQNAENSIEQCREWMISCVDCVRAQDQEEEQPGVAEILCSYIDAHMDENISRDTLASLVYMSPDHVGRIFKKEMGMTIFDYLLDRKMAHAAKMLSKTEFSVSYIAANIGYSNISHFSGAFKKQYGITPSEYRRRNGKISD
ncbi:MAG: response regulator [Coprococcus sp.]|nr:response regulator [Coprococcus sp.]